MKKDNIVGKYINDYEKGAVHYVELYPDSTFLHYYKSSSGEFKNKGKWTAWTDENTTKISLNEWKSFGEFKEDDCVNGCLRQVTLKNEKLVFNIDLPDEMNFRKINN
ncbi:MAG: hypothetical protein ACTHJ0_10525 [Flavipsychrobacter sp.]